MYPLPSDYNEAEENERQRRKAERLAEQAEEQADRDRAEYRNKRERQAGRVADITAVATKARMQ